MDLFRVVFPAVGTDDGGDGTLMDIERDVVQHDVPRILFAQRPYRDERRG